MSGLDTITLSSGSHSTREEGMNLAEAAAWLAGEQHTFRPDCVAQILAELGEDLSRLLPHDRRQRLVPALPEMIHTAGDGQDEARSYMVLDWIIRTWLPAWLDLSPSCRDAAVRVRELSRIVDEETAEAAGPVVRAARRAGEDSMNRRQSDDTADHAADYAAWVTAGNAIRAAARMHAADATRYADQDAAWDAARAAAKDVARPADDAAGALQPTLDTLQASLIDLYRSLTSPQA